MKAGTDATFGKSGAPLRLRAQSDEDLAILSALLQDAVGVSADIAWAARRRVFALSLSRFRWEDKDAAEAEGRPYERAYALLQINDVTGVRARGFDPSRKDEVFSILSLAFIAGEDGGGALRIICANDAEFELKVEAIDISLGDVAQPWAAKSAPSHPED